MRTSLITALVCLLIAVALARAEALPRAPESLHLEDPVEVRRQMLEDPRTRTAFAAWRKARVHIAYAPEAHCWVGTFHDAGRPLGYVVYADGQVREVIVRDAAAPEPPPRPPLFQPESLVPRVNPVAAVLLGLALSLLAASVAFRRLWPAAGRVLLLYSLPVAGVAFADPTTVLAVKMALVALLFTLMLLAARRPPPACGVEGRGRGWLVLAALCVLLGLLPLLTGEIADDSRSAGVGARYLLQEHRLPYGADISAGSWVERDRNTYGPLLYLLHAPAEAVAPTTYLAEGTRTTVGELGWSVFFDRRGMTTTASRITVTFFYLLLAAGVATLGLRMGGPRTACLWTALCALGPAVTGTACTGHLIPTALIVWAFVFLHRPAMAGIWLGLAASTFFYPIFAIPVWLGWYGRQRRWAPFALGLGCTGAAMLALVLLLTAAPTPAAALGVFLRDTVLMQEGAAAYGGTTMGFWGHFPALKAALQAPVMALYLFFCLALAWRPKAATPHALIALTAAVFLGTQLWKSLGPGYEAWYFTLIALAFFPGADDERHAAGLRS